MQIELLETAGWLQAIAGTRLSFNSESDSYFNFLDNEFYLGSKDRELLTKLVKAGPSHSKFMRMIQVWLRIDAPLYWWKQMDTYKIGTTTSSESTMHTIHKKPFTVDMFAVDALDTYSVEQFDAHIQYMNGLRQEYIKTKDKHCWRQLIQMLPSSFLQTRIVNLNYQVLRTIYFQRQNHRLQEWSTFCTWIEENMPYSELIVQK